jgi:hypothetical protein
MTTNFPTRLPRPPGLGELLFRLVAGRGPPIARAFAGIGRTQVIDQAQRSPNVPPVCFLSEPMTVSPLMMTKCSLLGSQRARGN